MPLLSRTLFLGVCLASFYTCTYIHVYAATTGNDISGPDLLTISANWNGIPLQNNATSTIQLDSSGNMAWNIGYSATSTELAQYLPIIANATYTFQLYKGVIGNSQLLYSKTISHGSATSSDMFPFAFPGAGPYMLTYTATYPDGTYPTNFDPNICRSDVCIRPQYSLEDFQKFMTNGANADPSTYGHPIPALFGISQFTISEPNKPKYSNVLFIPGIMESRLYIQTSNGTEKELWEPIHNDDMSLLAMNKYGQSENQIYTRDIVDSLYSNNPLLQDVVKKLAGDNAEMYLPFENFMDQLVQAGVIHKWEPFPYDWRFSPDSIVTNGTLVGTQFTEPHRIFLQDVVRELADSSPTGKVTIVGHSNGGLVAKALAKELEKSGNIGLVDKIIMVGTPQVGTPFAVGNLLHGDGQTRALGLVTKGSTMRELAQTMPGAYALLPSPLYFSIISSPLVTFSLAPALTPYRDAFGTFINASSTFSDFLTDTFSLHADAVPTDLRTPLTLISELLSSVFALHDAIDTWIPPSSLELASIAEIGQPTVSGYEYSTREESGNCSFITKITLQCKKSTTITHTPYITSQGDNTVVFLSAAVNPGLRFFFDAGAYMQETGRSITHQSMLSAQPVQHLILKLFEGTSTDEHYISTTTPPTNVVPDDTVLSTHSPMNLVVTDVSARKTGVVPIAESDMSFAQQDIPGSSLQTIDDENYIYVPHTGSYTVELQGTGIGETTIEIGRTNADGSIHTVQTFKDIPTSATTNGQFTVSDSVVSPISIDVDGDGTQDLLISSSSPTEMPENDTYTDAANYSVKRAGQSRMVSPSVTHSTFDGIESELSYLRTELLALIVQWRAFIARSIA